MATKLTKSVVRETEAQFAGRNIMAELDPAEGGQAVVTLWPKGTQQKYRVNLAFLYNALKSGAMTKVEAEVEKAAREAWDDEPALERITEETPAGERFSV